MKKIGYNERVNFQENKNNDVEMVSKIISQLNNREMKACEVPCGNKRNIELCKIFDYIYFGDINKKIISSFNNSKYSNYKALQMDIMALPSLIVDIILIMRQAMQMFNEVEIKKIIDGVRKKTTAKYILIDTFFYDGENLTAAPNYFIDPISVFETDKKIFLLRNTIIKIETNKIKLVHQYKQNGEIKYEAEMALINYKRKRLKEIFCRNGMKIINIFKNENLQKENNSNRSIFLLEVMR